MESAVQSEPRFPRRRALYESRREREFYRYYEPIRDLTGTGPPLCNLHDNEAAQAHLPCSSPDRALTAFCQLGALRLGARRAMLFFFDSNYAYVLAEATRTLSLLDDKVHEIDDALWLGHTIIPRGFSVCEWTVNLPSNSGSNRDESSSGIAHIINDLTGDVRFCDRPYVKSGPLARFYAGVPITTSKGLNIGAYCIVDDKPRDGLDEKSVTFLTDMAATVMTHLEMVRHTSDHKRNSRMVSGLSAFVDGADGLRKKDGRTGTHRTRKSTVSEPSEDPKVATTPPHAARLSNDEGFFSTNRKRVEIQTPPSDINDAPDLKAAGSVTADSGAEDLRNQILPSNIIATFKRVAEVVREAVEVDGVLFLDATVASYAGLIERSSSEQYSDSGPSASDTTYGEMDNQSNGHAANDELGGEPCIALGSSVISTFEHEAPVVPGSKRITNLGEKFLQSLLRKYPRGKIWNFNEEGDASSEDESSGSSSSQKGERMRSGAPVKPPDTGKLSRKRRRKRVRIDDGREIQRLFPGVRSLALVGMWDPIKGRWFAGCMVWTYSSLRLLSEQSELNFMTAFCDAIMAEVHRLEAQNADNAKMDFISSISHELRSPLHGILGSVECLQEQIHDASRDGLISQVEVCARTLLDIVNHLLDFSKINNYAKGQNHDTNNQHSRQRGLEVANATSRVGGKMTLDADVCLSEITEEVVEATFYSFCWSKDQQTIRERDVSYVLDIDRSPGINWRCRIATGGWKRICINLISNALKYTTQGYVHVSLKAVALRHKKRFNAILTVSDTGRGMSQGFLANQLFKAFSQEDTLVEGTGLGMSLVAKIVKALSGKVDVKSVKGIGTTVIVTIPLQHGPGEPELDTWTDTQLPHNISVGIFDPSMAEAESPHSTPLQSGHALSKASILRTCSELGLRIRHLRPPDRETTDLAFIFESDLLVLQSLADSGQDQVSSSIPRNLLSIPWVVLCRNTITERQLRTDRPGCLRTANVEFVSLPAGVNRLMKAIKACLPDDSRTGATNLNAVAYSPFGGRRTSTVAQLDTDIPVRLVSRAAQATKTHRRWLSDSIAYFPDGLTESLPLPVARVERPTRDIVENAANPLIDQIAIAQPKGVNNQKPNPKPTASDTQAATDSLCLLLVDDNQINLQLLVTYADKRKHRKITATNGLEAVEAYKAAAMKLNLPGYNVVNPSGKPQVVLMDINMPVLDGFEATRQIRQFEKEAKVESATIIALTGLGSADAQQEAYGSGVDLFLTKPVRLKELTRILEGLQIS